MMAAMVFLQAASDQDVGSLVNQLLGDLQGKAWVAAAVVGVMLVLAVLRKLGVLGGAKAADPAPDAKPAADASKAADLLDGKK